MMSVNELRAAAERVIQQVREYDSAGVAMLWEHKAKAVAEAYLAEHPADDGDGLSVEWMQAVGFVQSGGGWWRLGEGTNSMALDYHDNTEVGDVFRLPSGSYTPGINVQTRGQLRRLCAALGVPLKEGK